MTVNESDREDLMREATALRRRVEIVVSHESEPVIAGFRDDDRFSIFFGPDPVYHFNSEGQLRRGYCGGKLYRTQGSTLARLSRQRNERESLLLRYDLTPVELEEFLSIMDRRLSSMVEQLQANAVQVLEQIPSQPSLLPALLQALQLVLENSSDRLAPMIKA